MGRVLSVDEQLEINEDAQRNRFRFQFEGPRETVDEERVAQLLQPLYHILEEHHKNFKDMTSIIESIKFSGKSLTLPASTVVSDALRNLPPGLKEANIADILASQPTMEARQSLEALSDGLLPHAETIRLLDVSDNALGPAGVQALSQFLSRARFYVETLKFNNDGMAAAACQALADILTIGEDDEEEILLPLRCFEMFNNLAESNGAEGLARIFSRCPSLERVRVSSTRIGAEGCLALSKSLMSSTNLVSIDLSDNTFDDDAFLALSEAVAQSKNLTVLNLANLGMSSFACDSLCKALVQSECKLEVLDLSGNDIPTESAASIAKVIAANPSLKVLNLEENELQNAGIMLIAHVISETASPDRDAVISLKNINFRLNELTGTCLDRVLAMITSQKNSLESLDLNSNQFNPASVERLETSLKEMSLESILCEMDENDDEAESEEEEDVDISDMLADLKI